MRAIENTSTSARAADRANALRAADDVRAEVEAGSTLAVAVARIAGRHKLDRDHEAKLAELAARA